MIAGYEQLEEQLEQLGQRWASVCHWVEERCATTQNIRHKWSAFNDRFYDFTTCLQHNEKLLDNVKLDKSTPSDELVKQIWSLKVCVNE